MQNRGGFIGEADLYQIPRPVEREVLTSSYRGHEIHTFPPPGAGRVLVQIMNTLEGFPSDILNPKEPLGAAIFALAFRFALTNRKKAPVHPDYYLQTVNKMMSDKGYGTELAKKIGDICTFALRETYVPPLTSGETTHLSVVDKQGNAVGITQSIELVFGSKSMAEGLGFFYNNYMSDFEYKNMTHPYYLLPGGKPWSSVAPVLICKEGLPKFLLGSPGRMKIAIVYNRESQAVINLFGTLNQEKYGLETIKRIKESLVAGGHQVKTFEGDKNMIAKSDYWAMILL